jgi:hypothetical protein
VTAFARHMRTPCQAPDETRGRCGVPRDMHCPVCDAALCFRCAPGHPCEDAADNEPHASAEAEPEPIPAPVLQAAASAAAVELGDASSSAPPECFEPAAEQLDLLAYDQAPELDEHAPPGQPCDRCEQAAESLELVWCEVQNAYLQLCGACRGDTCQADSTTS